MPIFEKKTGIDGCIGELVNGKKEKVAEDID